MKANIKCLECSVSGFIDLMDEFEIDELKKEEHMKEFFKFLSTIDYKVSPPEIARGTNIKIKELLGCDDPYLNKKKLYNERMLEKYDYFKEAIRNSGNPLLKAITLAIGGNIIDFSPQIRNDINSYLDRILHTDLKINDADKLLNDLKSADSILYLTDNTGEIVLDKLLIETLLQEKIIDKEKIIVATRGYPILNDATLEDAEKIGLTKIVKVIGNGDYTPGTLLDLSSEEFRDAFNKADVVISKGQGNFESLEHIKEKNIYFMLIAKCQIVSKKLNVNIGDYICLKSN